MKGKINFTTESGKKHEAKCSFSYTLKSKPVCSYKNGIPYIEGEFEFHTIICDVVHVKDANGKLYEIPFEYDMQNNKVKLKCDEKKEITKLIKK
jgi:hypothetical protein